MFDRLAEALETDLCRGVCKERNIFTNNSFPLNFPNENTTPP